MLFERHKHAACHFGHLLQLVISGLLGVWTCQIAQHISAVFWRFSVPINEKRDSLGGIKMEAKSTSLIPACFSFSMRNRQLQRYYVKAGSWRQAFCQLGLSPKPLILISKINHIVVYWFWLTVLLVKTDIVYTLVVLFLTGLSVYGFIPNQVYTFSVIPNLVVTPGLYS